jgi:hypothetical protein
MAEGCRLKGPRRPDSIKDSTSRSLTVELWKDLTLLLVLMASTTSMLPLATTSSRLLS